MKYTIVFLVHYVHVHDIETDDEHVVEAAEAEAKLLADTLTLPDTPVHVNVLQMHPNP